MGKSGWWLSQEIYKAINSGLPSLAAMGIRALIEMLAERLCGRKIYRFEVGMNTLVNDDLITQSQKEILNAALEPGHGAMHRNYFPDMEDVQHALDIVEGLINFVIVSKKKALELKERVPPKIVGSKKIAPRFIPAAPPSSRRCLRGGCGAPGSHRPPRGLRRK